jgi:hypothetical protein
MFRFATIFYGHLSLPITTVATTYPLSSFARGQSTRYNHYRACASVAAKEPA